MPEVEFQEENFQRNSKPSSEMAESAGITDVTQELGKHKSAGVKIVIILVILLSLGLLVWIAVDTINTNRDQTLRIVNEQNY